MEQPEEQEITMDILTEDEKAAIDDAPNAVFDFLFNNILEHGRMPEYFVLIIALHDKPSTVIKYEGDKVDAAIMYYEYLIAKGYRSDTNE